MSLKSRLTLGTAALLVVVVAVLGWVAVEAARSSMIKGVDDRLRVLAARKPAWFTQPATNPPPLEHRDRAEFLVTPEGQRRLVFPAGFATNPDPLPLLPDGPVRPVLGTLRKPVTVAAETGDLSYRIMATPLPGGNFRVLATPLDEVDAAVARTVRLVLVAGGAVLLLGCAGYWLLVRRGMRPVDGMVRTAAAIAGGDLTPRVQPKRGGAELDRLGSALDEMLDQIETAFAAREAGTHRLREFVADASHELRTPLSAIRGYAELYRSGAFGEGDRIDGERLDRAMRRIESESERMGRLVEDLLLLAQLDQTPEPGRTEVDITALAEDAAADLRAADPGRPVEVLAAGPVPVSGDEHQLRQLIGNLLSNARQHTAAGTPVRVSVHGDDATAVLVVVDEGPGIPAEHREKIFERFYRADGSRSRSTGGTGLGLAIVKAIARAHEGTVRVLDSERGARFEVRLPLSGRSGS
ncbi:sensor histidine kinase [Amycolatopsis nigrescens]|uniref:sensor histidine kinase n=1 Tax=Amycolatopsis nigrescens TaxID=381445 RepID=UPI00037729F7|nr:HAMP domain-containing sensor histidine kinase [Amycolatopsis nigrescens]